MSLIRIAFISIFMVLSFAGITYSETVNPYPPFLDDLPYSTPTEEQKEWALGTCAMLVTSNNGRTDLLGGHEKTTNGMKSIQEALVIWWGANDRAELLDKLKFIEEGGHRVHFDKIAFVLSNASAENVALMRENSKNDPDLNNALEIVEKYYKEFGKKSLSGWDYSRYVMLCGWGYVAGYLTEEEAWRKIMPAARLIQKNFGSWEDMGKNYLVGREFWSRKGTLDSGDLMRRCNKKLLEDKDSPWVRHPWSLDLKPKTAQIQN